MLEIQQKKYASAWNRRWSIWYKREQRINLEISLDAFVFGLNSCIYHKINVKTKINSKWILLHWHRHQPLFQVSVEFSNSLTILILRLVFFLLWLQWLLLFMQDHGITWIEHITLWFGRLPICANENDERENNEKPF